MKKFTKIESMKINQFRGLKNVSIDFGNRVTLICGKNGTSKSTILGIIAQIFSFSTDYTTTPTEKNKLRAFKTLLGKNFESKFSEHFRFSEAYDIPGSMDVNIKLYDGIEKKQKNNLTLKLYDSKDRSKSRPVLRGNNDRNITNPLIYLSVNRLTPIVSRKYSLSSDEYISKKNKLVLQLTNRILLQKNTKIDVTDGAIGSLAPHNENFDFQSISVGEDNVGQIVRALLSFIKLKEEYSNYSGGILLIDEVDAGLFPAAQIEFFHVLTKFCKDYNVQAIMTSHSPTMIEEIYNQKDTNSYKVNYLTNTYGNIQVKPDYSWSDIEADILVRTKTLDKELKLPKVNIYCEDIEARQLFNALIRKRKLTRLIDISKTSLGGDQLISLSNEKLPEFCSKSIVILDVDKNIENRKNFCNLPGNFPPDQLLFDYLKKLPPDSPFWENEIRFNNPVFERIANNYLTSIGITTSPDSALQEEIDEYRSGSNNKEVVRDKFKKFFKDEEVQQLFKIGIDNNPFTWWKKSNISLAEEFENNFIHALKHVLIFGHKAPKASVEEYFKSL
ncbi:AAA family ATPase [Enterococcus faecium]|uniref:AAA family ATPase n=1 Tax=Enterococcus faecium TaxID=1352 RepID=UPI00115F767E|nr:AAA family ATPase [Enterococcus faecium]